MAKTAVKAKDNNQIKSTRFSKLVLIVFALIFACIGGYALYRSFAAGNPNTYTCTGRSFYISYSAGSDSNNGISKSAPWRNAPGMADFSGSYSHQSGDCFYFEGGVTWPNASFPLTTTGSGTATNPDYYGPDYSWYSGSSWSRPIFNANSNVIAGAKNQFVDMSHTDHVTFDNFEMTGFYWNNSPAFQTCQYILAYSATNDTFNHLYMHGWTHAGAATDDCTLITGMSGAPNDAGTVIQDSVFDGSDSTTGGDSMFAAQYMGTFKNNVCNHLANCWVGAPGVNNVEISGNLCENLQISFTGVHENCIETAAANTATVYVHDNVLANAANGDETMFLGNTGETDYVWNNVVYGTGNQLDFDPGGNGVYIWNNTIDTSYQDDCLRLGVHGSMGTEPIQIINNHCINPVSTYLTNGGTVTANNNMAQTESTANSNGYSTSSTYAYAPTLSNGATIAAGANLSSDCSSAISLCSDTTYAVAYNTANHTATVPARTVNNRPSSSAWDIGAYQYTSSNGGSSGSILGDCNGDDVVNINDLSVLLSEYNTNATSCDFNHDGIVNILDFSIMLSNYGATAPTSYTIPTSIASDCSVDVTTPILNWLATVPDNSTASFGSGKCYRIEGTLTLQNRTGLDLEGNGSTFKSLNAVTPTRSIWQFYGSTGIKLNNMSIIGSYTTPGTFNSSVQYSHGIALLGTNATITNTTIENVAGDCVYFGLGSDNVTRSSGSYLTSTCNGTGRNAVSLVAANNVLVQNVSTDNVGYETFDVEPNEGAGYGDCNDTFDSNTINNYALHAYSVVESAPICNQSFTNNRVIGPKGMTVAIGDPLGAGFRPNTIVITGNTGTNAATPSPINADNVDILTVTGNTVPMTVDGYMAAVTYSCKVNVSGNSFPGGGAELYQENPTTGC